MAQDGGNDAAAASPFGEQQLGGDRTGGGRTFIMLFPGNPYIYDLYSNLLGHLEKQGEDHGVVARIVKYVEVPEELLHDHSAAFQLIAKDVMRQIDEVYASHDHRAGHDKVVIVAHSFGSYIANMVVPHVEPHASIFIFPFLARPTFSGRLTLRVADLAFRKAPAVGRLLHPTTTSLFNVILRSISSPSKRFIQVDPEALRAIFRVAACEGPEIAAKKDLSHVDLEGGRTYLFYTKGDQWCPHWVWENWPAERRLDMSHIPHAFPCQEDNDVEVARAVMDLVRQLPPQAAPNGSSSSSGGQRPPASSSSSLEIPMSRL